MNAAAQVGLGAFAGLLWLLGRKRRVAHGDVTIGTVEVKPAAAAKGAELEQERAQQAQRSALVALGYNVETADLEPANPKSPGYRTSIDVAEQIAAQLDRVGLPGEASYLRQQIRRARELAA